MIHYAADMEMDAVMATARRMCAAARTAPKAKGIDNLERQIKKVRTRLSRD